MVRKYYAFLDVNTIYSIDSCLPHVTPFLFVVTTPFTMLPSGVIVSIDLDRREVVVDDGSVGYRVVHLVYPPTKVVIFIQSAYDAGLHIPPFKRGEIAVSVETRTFEVTGLHEKLYVFKRAQIPLLPGHLSSVYRAQVRLAR